VCHLESSPGSQPLFQRKSLNPFQNHVGTSAVEVRFDNLNDVWTIYFLRDKDFVLQEPPGRFVLLPMLAKSFQSVQLSCLTVANLPDLAKRPFASGGNRFIPVGQRIVA
jgi:hypothetical protein